MNSIIVTVPLGLLRLTLCTVIFAVLPWTATIRVITNSVKVRRSS